MMARQVQVPVVMQTNQQFQPLHQHAPDIVRALRRTFDERLMDLHRAALDEAARGSEGVSTSCHIDFPAGALMVTAVYDTEQDRFTQLIARAADEARHQRPSFTISLFL